MIEIKQLSRGYGDVAAVQNISAKLVNGRIYGLLGPADAGKTTLLEMMAGVLAPTEGFVKINGTDLWEKPRDARAQLAYLPARLPLYEDMTPTEYLTFVARARGVSSERVGGQVRLALETAELEEVAHRLIRRLTPAQACRTGLAQLMPGTPELLLVDDLTEVLPPEERSAFWSALRKVAEGRTVLLAGRDYQALAELCDELLVLSEGQLVARGTPEELEGMPELFDIVHKESASDAAEQSSVPVEEPSAADAVEEEQV